MTTIIMEKFVTAVLPMKGHSERVPNKNLRDFNGKPLFFHIAASLQNSQYVNEILINTDSEDIAELAGSFSKVRIIERPPELCGDMVSMNKIIEYDMTQSESEYFLQTHSTNPLLKTSTIDQAILAFYANLPKKDSLFSVTGMQTRLYWENGEPVNHNPNELIRTQDLPKIYEENSNIFLFSKESFAKADNKRIGLRPLLFGMNKLEATDIDEEEDFILAEVLAGKILNT